MKTRRFILISTGGLLIVALTITTAAVLTGNLGRPILCQLPPGYRGWVIVQYQNPICPPMSREGIYLTIRIPPSGRACTSSPMPMGWRYEHFEYVYEDGRRKALRSSGWDDNSEIWPLSASAEKNLEFLFVGSQRELNQSWGSRPDRPSRE